MTTTKTAAVTSTATAAAETAATVVVKSLKLLTAARPKGTDKPWQTRIYAFPHGVMNTDLLSQAPDQVKAMLKFAADKPKETRFTGPQLAGDAVAAGALKTKQDPAIIFAYYRRMLEVFGLQTVAYATAPRKVNMTEVKAVEVQPEPVVEPVVAEKPAPAKTMTKAERKLAAKKAA